MMQSAFCTVSSAAAQRRKDGRKSGRGSLVSRLRSRMPHARGRSLAERQCLALNPTSTLLRVSTSLRRSRRQRIYFLPFNVSIQIFTLAIPSSAKSTPRRRPHRCRHESWSKQQQHGGLGDLPSLAPVIRIISPTASLYYTQSLGSRKTMFRRFRLLLSIVVFIFICKISQHLSEKGNFHI